MPFLVQDYLTGTVVLSELMCGKPRRKVTSYSKLGFLKFQDIPFTDPFSLFSGIYFVVLRGEIIFYFILKGPAKFSKNHSNMLGPNMCI